MSLYDQFADPKPGYSLWPYWLWGVNVDENRLYAQIDRMIAQGIYGAIIFPWQDMPQPYLSESYFALLRSVLNHAAKREFAIGLLCDVGWPHPSTASPSRRPSAPRVAGSDVNRGTPPGRR